MKGGAGADPFDVWAWLNGWAAEERKSEMRNVILEFPAVVDPEKLEVYRAAFSKHFSDKLQTLRGQGLVWLDYSINCVFPRDLYERNNRNLQALLDDPELGNFKLGVNGNQNFSYLGRLEYWNKWNGKPYRQMSYLLKRMKLWPGTKTFMFYTSTPDWLYASIDTNMAQPKTGRTNWACLSAVDFKRDTDGTLLVTAFARNIYSTHMLGDLIGLSLMNRAVAEAVGLEPGNVVFHATNVNFDRRKDVKAVLEDVIECNADWL